MTFIEKLIEARRLIAGGWVQGSYHKDGRHCAMGALFRADIDERGFRFSGYRNRHESTPAGHLVAWNDKPGRTREEVLAMFDNSIAALERNAQER